MAVVAAQCVFSNDENTCRAAVHSLIWTLSFLLCPSFFFSAQLTVFKGHEEPVPLHGVGCKTCCCNSSELWT